MSYPEQLSDFVEQIVLPAAPRALWWVLVALVFSGLNLVFDQEVWPHTPQAESFWTFALCSCLTALPWLGAATARRIILQMTGGWVNLWKLVAGLCYFGIFISLFVFLLGVLLIF